MMLTMREILSREEGMDKLSSLVTLLLKDNKIDEVKKVTTNAKYREEMLEKYSLL